MFRIPSGLQQIIPPAAAKKVMELLHQPALTQAVKDAAQKIGWPDIQAPGQIQEIWQQAKQWMESTLHTGAHPIAFSSAVINGTGKIFHSTLGGVPLPLGIADQAARMLSYMTAQSIEEQLRETLCKQSGAEDALVVCSLEHAVGLLNHLPQAADGWLVPRSDYVSWSADAHFGNCLDTSTHTSIAFGSITQCTEQDLLHSVEGNSTWRIATQPAPCWRISSSRLPGCR
jgi:seryl-tRNA(Sec) selenium transferase